MMGRFCSIANDGLIWSAKTFVAINFEPDMQCAVAS